MWILRFVAATATLVVATVFAQAPAPGGGDGSIGAPGPGGARTEARIAELAASAREALEREEFGRAVAPLEELHRLRPDDDGVARALAGAHSRLGAQQYARGDWHLAERSYRAAARLLPSQPDVLQSLGAVLIALQRPGEARAALLRCVDADPSRTAAWRMLARLAEEEDDHEAAAAFMRRASESAPERDDLARQAAELERRREVESNFASVVRGRVRVQHAPANAAAARLVAQVCGWVEQALAELEHELGPMPPGAVTVVLYTRDEYVRVNVHAWAQAFYDGKIRLPLTAPAALRSTLRHEAAHAYLHAAHPGAPAWVHEGWAQHVQGRSPSAARTSLAAVAMPAPPPSAFWQTEFVRARDHAAVQAGYDQALLAVTWLLRAHGRQDFVRFLAQLDAGDGSDTALLLVYGHGFDELVLRSR